MKYFDPESIKSSQAIKNRLQEFSGPTVRKGRALEILNDYAARFFSGRKDMKILDCGTASGRFVEDLRGAGSQNIYGIEIDDYLGAPVKSLLKDFKTADLSFKPLPWDSGFFDILTGWCLVPHLENPHNFIREAYRALNRNGLLIFSSINITSPSHRKYFFKTGNFPVYHEQNNNINLFTPAIFQKTVLRYFELVGTEHFIAPSTFLGWKGTLRRFVYDLTKGNKMLRSKLDERWGPKIVYILQKKNEDLIPKS